ncbi:hypothetical protein AMELA_G00242910 [Ameiurus melas]|uniref:Ig-like domain-containing protein n=1 Tax=Ameiurus melas TaxID=219545 RepID=A0A7J5ZZT7_AMEME|nr:hypothetical protein AMELA_G00242910 [Ameiurus melas]
MCGCELDDDGTTRGYSQHGYDGEDFLSLDLRTLTWIAPTPQAVFTKNKWEETGAQTNFWKNFLEKECIDLLNRHLSYGRETLERKVRPKASVVQKNSSPPEVVCHATGFFPKTVMITWQKDGEDVHEDVDLGETLPNQDGSFQKRSILTVSAEDLQKHTYTCVIQHSSLEKPLVVHRKDLRNGGPLIGIIVGVVTALVALAGVVGFLVWKKKSGTGFQTVPQNSSQPSDDDSSFNNSNTK